MMNWGAGNTFCALEPYQFLVDGTIWGGRGPGTFTGPHINSLRNISGHTLPERGLSQIALL